MHIAAAMEINSRLVPKMKILHSSIHSKSRCSGPRQPWHDWHCKIEGPAAYDIYTNFEQRWGKATRYDLRFKKVTPWGNDALLCLDRISWILTPSADNDDDDEALRVSDEEDPENWHVQVFRSIDSGYVKGFPSRIHEAEAKHLVSEKNLKVDKSIHTAYVKAIRSAQHFIYIENQYFLGSSYCWPSYKNAGAENLIPMELALKIANKISKYERFSVYIVIPMWLEGEPTSAVVQEILFWQFLPLERALIAGHDLPYKAVISAKFECSFRQYKSHFMPPNRCRSLTERKMDVYH